MTNGVVFRSGIIASIVLCAHPLFGGVVLDGSLGTRGPLPGPNFMIQANFGRQVGGNLFQSFSQFNLNSSQSATFTGPANVHNILARVTSGSPSSIDGRIQSDIQGANLFFMNPAGVLFGQHAQLDVSGSFAVTTANYLKLAGGGRFNANLGGGDVLTSAPVSAFGFLNTTPAAVSINGSFDPNLGHFPTLQVAPQKSFSVVAGDITITGGKVVGAGSRVNLVSVRSAGEAQLAAADFNSAVDVSQFAALGEIDLSNSAQIAVSGLIGGPVVIRGGMLSMDDCQIFSTTSGSIQGGTIDVDVTGDLKIVNDAFFSTKTSGGGLGGNLSIHAGSLLIDGSGSLGLFTGIAAETTGSATGNAGALAIRVDQVLRILAGGEIVDSTFSSGNGSNLTIEAGSLLIDGSAIPDYFTGIASGSHPGATGGAGDLNIVVDQALNIVGHGEISAGTFSSGKAGNLTIQAGSLSIDGSATPDLFTGIGVDTQGNGNAGSLTITVDRALSIAGHGEIEVSTFSSGNGGNLTIHAGSLSIDGSATPDHFTGIASGSNPGATGDAGDLNIVVDQALNIVGHGEISASTFSSGNAGNLTIHAGSLSIDGSATPDHFTGIASDSNPGATGDAGDLNIVVDQALNIVGHGEIGASTFSSGKAGNSNIHAGSLLIDGSATPELFTGIDADTQGNGNAGNLTLTVDRALSIAGHGEVEVSTFSSGNGGNLTIHAGSLSIDGSAAPEQFTGILADSASGATGNAGDLTIVVGQMLSVVGSGQITADTYSGGKGGNLTIHSGSLSIDGSATTGLFTGISADSNEGATGNAGDLTIVVGQTLSVVGGGQIGADTFSSGKGGNLSVHAGSISIDGSGSDFFTGISADTEGSGNAGNLTVTVDHALSISGGSEISANTFSSGKGGNLNIHAGSISIDGSASNLFTGISADTEGSGHAGNLTVTVDHALSMVGSGEISASTSLSGKGGDVTVNAGSIFIDNAGQPPDFTGIFAEANDGVGNGGNVAVNAGSVLLQKGGSISAESFTSGAAGSVYLSLGTLTMGTHSSISSANTSSGAAGSVFIETRCLMQLGRRSSVSTSAVDGGAGSVAVNAADLTITGGSNISSSTSGTGDGGSVSVMSDSLLIREADSGIFAEASSGSSGNAGDVMVRAGDLTITDGGLISSSTFSSGRGGDVMIQAGSLLIDGSGAPGSNTGIFVVSNEDATGDAGNLTITIDKLLSIVGVRSSISAATFSSGEGGSISIHAGSLSIDGSGSPTSDAGVVAASYATGNAGNLSITVDGSLNVVRSGKISAETHSNGNGGDVTVHARSLSIDGSGITADTFGIGDAGDLTITVDKLLTVAGGGQISARTFFSSGNAGDVTVDAESLSIDGAGIPPDLLETGIFVSSGSENPNARGNAGNLTITVDKLLSIVGSGRIAADTFSSGKGGDISIHAGSLSIDGSANPHDFTGIEADSSDDLSADAMGDAGNVTIRVDEALSVVGSGGITAATFTNGNGGNLTIHAGSLLIDGSATPGFATGIFVASYGTSYGSGEAGSVSIETAGPVKLKHGATISTSSETTDAGSIDITSGGKIKLKDHSEITVSAGHNGGDIHIMSPELVYLLDSSIKATAGANGVNGAGGNITIDSQFIVLNNSLISANAAVGQGGNIRLVSDFFFNSDLSNSNITATGTTNGTVNITAPVLDLGSELITLPTSLLSAESQLQERCTALLRGDFSSFISIGRGGTEPAPEELQSTF